MKKNKSSRSGGGDVHGQSQRQLKVGEELRHVIAEFFIHSAFYEGVLSGCSVTVSEVRVSPDLKNATVFATCLGGKIPEGFIAALEAMAPMVKQHISKYIRLRYMPTLRFKLDDSFDRALQMDALFNSALSRDTDS